MKKLAIVLFLFPLIFSAQVAQYNQFPSMRPMHILDDNLTDISFAFGMRILESDYNGALIRLRRASDDAELDFYCNDEDKVDIDAINTWRGTANVYVVIWYDQSGLGRNAVQPINAWQPQFIPDADLPYFQGDGSSHRLDVNTSIQILTNAGANGSVLTILNATNRSQHSFGVISGYDRWSTHINWNNGSLYFDPGICCNSTRTFLNTTGANQWKQYTLLRGTNTVAVRKNGNIGFSGSHTSGRCTLTNNFGILHANGAGGYATTKINEMIMYSTDVSSTQYSEIEENQIAFWGL